MMPRVQRPSSDVDHRRWVLVFAFVLVFWNLWGYDLWAPDEPYFGEGAREMIVDGEWLVPHVDGEITTDKPPLFFWLIAVFSLPFGAVSSFTARLPSMLAALGTIALTMEMGRRMAGRWPAVIAGSILVTSHMFWDKARSAQIDSLLCFLVTIAVFHFAAFRAGEIEGRRAGIIFWLAAALAVLAKGPVGLALPLGIAVTTLVVDRSLRSWGRFAPVAGPVVFAVIIAAWMTSVTIWGGEYSVIGAFRTHVVERAIHGMHHVQPPWYYLTVLPYALLPWSFLLPGALLVAWRRRGDPDDRLLLVYFLFVVVFFSIPTEKRDLYILPSLPAFALLTARLIVLVEGIWSEEGREQFPHRKWVTIPQGLVGAIFVLAAIAAPLAAARLDVELLWPSVGLSVVFGIGGIAILVSAVRGWPLRAVQCSGATMALAMIVAVTFVYPPLNPDNSARELAGVIKEHTGGFRDAGHRVLAFDLGNVTRGISFYSDGIYLEKVSDADVLVGRLARRETAFLVGNEKTFPELPESVRRRATRLYSTHQNRRDIVVLRFDAEASPDAGVVPVERR